MAKASATHVSAEVPAERHAKPQLATGPKRAAKTLILLPVIDVIERTTPLFEALEKMGQIIMRGATAYAVGKVSFTEAIEENCPVVPL